MINYLRHMAVFAKVVDKGSFLGAAKELDLVPSRVSQTISDLEQYTGVTLLYRTTRKLTLTHEGKHFYVHPANMLRDAEAGLNGLNALSQKPVGTLKITLPALLESSPVSSAIADFVKQYPGVSISLNYTDQIVDMFDSGLDLRLRVGAYGIDDSAMMSRKIGDIRRILVAHKTYIKQQPKLQHPSELEEWEWVHFQMRPNNSIEFIAPSHQTIIIPENFCISVNSANALKHFVSHHMGVNVLPENLVEEEIDAGKIVHLLPEWEVKPLECYAIWPDRSRRENLTMKLVRYLVEKAL